MHEVTTSSIWNRFILQQKPWHSRPSQEHTHSVFQNLSQPSLI